MPDLPVVPPDGDSPQPPECFAPDPRLIRMGQLIGVLLRRASLCEQFKMQPTRDAKMNAMLDGQAVLMEAVAFVLNELLLEAGAPPGLKFERREEAPADGPVLVRP